MFDHRLRPLKDLLLGPIAAPLAGRIGPTTITALSVLAGLGAAAAAWRGSAWLALGLWIINRLLDGLDGAVARAGDGATDLGGYLDLVADFIVYAALPFGVAFGLAPSVAAELTGGGAAGGASSVDGVIAIGARDPLLALAALMAAFYVNAAAWLALSSILEKRAAGAPPRAHATTIVMPAGVIGGAETAVLYALMLALPGESIGLMWLMAVLVAISAMQRGIWAVRTLPERSDIGSVEGPSDSVVGPGDTVDGPGETSDASSTPPVADRTFR